MSAGIGYKKAFIRKPLTNKIHENITVIVKIDIPNNVARVGGYLSDLEAGGIRRGKMRCAGAKVLGAWELVHVDPYYIGHDPTRMVKLGREISESETIYSRHFPNFSYHIGDYITPAEPFDPDPWNTCTSGIHYFDTMEEAARYDNCY